MERFRFGTIGALAMSAALDGAHQTHCMAHDLSTLEDSSLYILQGS